MNVSINSSPATPLEYSGNFSESLHSYGGYAPNLPPISTSLTNKAKCPPSTYMRDYLLPHICNPRETTSKGNVFLGRSGYSAGKALHLPSPSAILRTNRDLAANFYDPKATLTSECAVPRSCSTENHERFGRDALAHVRCGMNGITFGDTWMHCPGSRETGFTSCYSSVNPVYWSHRDSMMDQLAKNDIRSNAASVSQTDYQPCGLISYETAPIQGTFKPRGRPTGFAAPNRELEFCFLPRPCVYNQHTGSYVVEGQFDTIYNREYQYRPPKCPPGLGNVAFPRKPKPLTGEPSPDFSLGCGPPLTYLSETRDRFYSHWPLEGQRTFGLSKPISKVSPSGFIHSTKNHNKNKYDSCVDVDLSDTAPQRYNPWPRHLLGHNTLVDKNYRPNPIKTGIDYTITNSLPTTSDSATMFLY